MERSTLRALGLISLVATAASQSNAQFGVINDTGFRLFPPLDLPDANEYGTEIAVGNQLTVVVGAPSISSDSSRVFVHSVIFGSVIHEITAPPAVPASDVPFFGSQVAADESSFVVSTSTGQLTGPGGGDQVFVYDLLSGDLRFELEPLNAINDDSGFGADITIDNGIVAVSQPRYDNGKGAVYLFDATDGSQIDVFYADTYAPGVDSTFFGRHIELKDGLLAVAQRGLTETGGQAVYLIDTDTGALRHEVQPPPDNEFGDRWGDWIAMNSESLVVCAPFDDPFGENTGSAYVYDIETGMLTTPLNLMNPNQGVQNQNFEVRAEISDDGLIAVHSSRRSGPVSVPYAVVKLFSPPLSSPVATLEPTGGRAGQFGASIAMIQNLIYVSDPSGDIGDQDAVYQFFLGAIIAVQPQSLVVQTPGFGPTMEVIATNASAYQWFKDGSPVANGDNYAGATTSLLSINAGPETEGEYICRVTSPNGGSEFTEPAYLVFQGAVAPACQADFNGDNLLNFFDFVDFIAQFNSGCP